MTKWLEFDTAAEVAIAAADSISEAAADAISQRGVFSLVLAGGSTPLACYRELSRRDLDWDRWQLFYGDERCLAADDAERNHRMVMGSGLTANIDQHFIIPAELGPELGAAAYQRTIADRFPFDLVLLGMGEDGHTASLFPNLEWQVSNREQRVIAVEGAPKPPPERISMSPVALQDCRRMMVLVTGQGKRAAIRQWQQGVSLPVASVASIPQATVYIERGLME